MSVRTSPTSVHTSPSRQPSVVTRWLESLVAQVRTETSPLKQDVVGLRLQAAQLLNAVLEEQITPRRALNTWPAPMGVDSSLDVAFAALAHFEADQYDDDKIQQNLDPYYLDAQLAWLNQLYTWLRCGQAVPSVFYAEYQKTKHTTGWYTESTVGLAPLWRGISMLGNWLKQCQLISRL